MAFYGCDFIFDGKRASTILQPSTPGTPYKRLMVYNFGSYGQDDVDFSVGEIAEDRINRRYDSLLYGLVQNEPLQFTLVFGIDPDDLSGETCFTRTEIAKITEWLTGHQEYKNLRIDQDDMSGYQYKVMVTGLKLISDGGLPTAFSAEITCDSPYAYKLPVQYTTVINEGGVTYRVYGINNTAPNRYYYPVIQANLTNATEIQMKNLEDGSRTMLIDQIPSGSITINIDCQNQVITSSNGYNLYPGFNNKFLRLVPGENDIEISTDGEGTVIITCEFPVNIGA